MPPESAPALPDALAESAPLAPIVAPIPPRPRLHVSGFDPRAAGGRQQLKLELRGMPADCASQLTLLASSSLRLDGGERHALSRTARGDWLPVFLEFSSRGLEHGQYRIELALHSPPDGDARARAWVATLLILVPRADASLVDIHQAFLATHKNVRVSADDASIARVRGQLDGGGRLDIDVSAHNAGIAHLDLDTLGAGAGKIDLGFSSIAWDEDLLEIDLPAGALPGQNHPCPASTACLVADAPGRLGARYLRLFALDQCVLGRSEADAQADILLAHHDGTGLTDDGLTRRLSARHAILRHGREGVEIEDVSRFGLLVDGVAIGKHVPVTLEAGMRIDFTASIAGVAALEVAAVLPHGVVLRRADGGREHELLYVLEPEHAPEHGPEYVPSPDAGPGEAVHTDAPALPLLFHRNGGFWHRDPASGLETELTPADAGGLPGVARFAAHPYPESRRAPGADRRALSALAAAAR